MLLQTIDRKWREHLYEVDYLKQGISLRAYAQRDPVIEYQREAFDMFQTMLDGIKEESVRFLMNAELKTKTTEGGATEPEAQIRGLEPLRKPEMLLQSAPSIDNAQRRAVHQEATTEDGSVFKRPPKPVPGREARREAHAGRGVEGRREGGPEVGPLGGSAQGRDRAAGAAGEPAAAPLRKSGAERAVPVRFGQEVQALPRGSGHCRKLEA